jgi:hypothetical protein
MRSPCCLCVSVAPLSTVEWKLGVYNMVPEPTLVTKQRLVSNVEEFILCVTAAVIFRVL